MKNMNLLLALSLCLTAFARETTLEFDLTGKVFVNHNRVLNLKIANVNKRLHAKGIDGLPERLAVTKNAAAYWRILMDRIEAGNKAQAYKTEMHFDINSGYFYEFPAICYRGKTEDVSVIIDAMMKDNFLNSEQGLLAMRWGTHKDVRSDQFKSDEGLREYYQQWGDENENEIKSWVKYNTKSENVLIMSDLGPQGDGTELYATVIKPCAE